MCARRAMVVPATPGKNPFCAIRRDLATIAGKPPGLRGAALVQGRFEVAAHDAEPVGIGRNLVFRIDGCDRILKIGDRRERGFKHDIRNARPIARRRSDGSDRSPAGYGAHCGETAGSARRA